MIAFIIKNGPTMALLVLCVAIFGLMSYVSLPRESAPDVKIPVVLITTPYIGVSPEDVETLITNPIENELAGVKDVKKMSSTSAEGVSIVSLEFEPEVVIEDALQRVRDRVNRAKSVLPEDAEEPEVREISFSDWPIMMINIAGPVDEQKLKHLGEELDEELRRIQGVLEITVTGGLEEQIRIQVDPVRLAHYGFSLDDIMSAVGNENVNVPGGEVTTGASSYLLRVPGEFKTAADIERMAIKRYGDQPVFVRDVARVIDGFEDRSNYARMNGESSVSVAVKKRAGANIIKIADEAKVIVARHAESWPEGVSFRVLSDQSENISDMVTELENNIITALLLVMAVVLVFMETRRNVLKAFVVIISGALLFVGLRLVGVQIPMVLFLMLEGLIFLVLGVRNSLFVAFSIPMSMLLSFIVVQALDMTLNMVVLFSLILALGMLVDNAIVIVENIYRHMEEGKSTLRAAIDGTNEVGKAVAASTATTVAAFFPLIFWTGIMGQFMGYLPKTVIIVLVSSLVVAVTALPVGARWLMTTGRALRTDDDDEHEQAPPNAFMRGYQRLLEFSIDHRYVVSGLGFALLFITFGAYGALNHGTEFFPSTEPAQATISVRAPDGTDLETTDRMVRKIEGMLSAIENVDVYVAETGVSGGGGFAGAQAVANQARITVDFLPDRNGAEQGEKIRVESTNHTIETIRKAVEQIPGAEILVEKQTMGPPVGASLSVEVSGDDFHEVGLAAAKVRRELAKIKGATDLSDDYKVGRPEMRLRINRGAAKRVGASTNDVARTIRTANAGTKAGVIRNGEDESDIVVELDPRYRSSLQDILALRIPGREDKSPDTFAVPLSTVASYELAGGSGSLRHIDQDLVVTIEGDVADGFNENAVRQEVRTYIDDYGIQDGIALRLGGADDEQRGAQEFLGKAFLLALFLIAIVLVSQFNGFALPAIIMASVALSLVGVLWGLIITGTSFGIVMTGIGVISLAGVVVNNAIVLLDYVEQLRDRGFEVRGALIRAGLTRFRPVMLTAVTTILGLVPMALGISIDFARLRFIFGGSSADFWGGMAVAVIFGLAFATILTLVMVPTLYGIVDDGRLFAARMLRSIRGVRDSPKEPDPTVASEPC